MKSFKKILKVTLITGSSLVLLIVIHSSVPRKISAELKSKALYAYQQNKSKISKDNYIIIVDYSRDILQKRLWLYDVKNNEALLNTRVSHALKSGLIYCNDISNKPNTEKTCIGSFVTGNQYIGKFGNSMNIHGLDKSNSNAYNRRIVFHSNCNHKYYGITIPSFLAIYSLGCFAFHEDDMDPFIDKVKDGVFMYVDM